MVGTGARFRADLVWDAERIVVEVDGPGHARPDARRRDAERDALLGAAGWTVIRIWHADFAADPASAIEPARQALRARYEALLGATNPYMPADRPCLLWNDS